MEQLQKIPADRPSVYEGVQVSFGIAPILNTLSNLSTQSSRPSWTLYLINVETLIRDRKEDTKDPVVAAKAVITDMQVLSQYIAAYNRYTLTSRTKETQPILCFYFPHYENIPKAYLREKLPSGTEQRWKIRDAIEKIISTQGLPSAYDDTQVFYAVVGTKGPWPHKDLLKDLAKLVEGIQYRKVLMISHVPLDFHLYRQFKEFHILESYTGALKTQKQLGKKVFGDDTLPFNKYLHLLLGDRWYLKSLVKTTTKNEMKKRAIKEHWAIIPDKGVLMSLVSMIPIPSDLFVKPDL